MLKNVASLTNDLRLQKLKRKEFKDLLELLDIDDIRVDELRKARHIILYTEDKHVRFKTLQGVTWRTIAIAVAELKPELKDEIYGNL